MMGRQGAGLQDWRRRRGVKALIVWAKKTVALAAMRAQREVGACLGGDSAGAENNGTGACSGARAWYARGIANKCVASLPRLRCGDGRVAVCKSVWLKAPDAFFLHAVGAGSGTRKRAMASGRVVRGARVGQKHSESPR